MRWVLLNSEGAQQRKLCIVSMWVVPGRLHAGNGRTHTVHLLGSSLAHGIHLDRGAPSSVWKHCCLLCCQKASHDHMLGAAPVQTIRPAMLPRFL